MASLAIVGSLDIPDVEPQDPLEIEREASRLASGLLTDSPAAALERLAGHADIAILAEAIPALENPLGDLDPSALPSNLVESVAALWAALGRAESLRRDALADLTVDEQNLFLSGDAYATRLGTAPSASATLLPSIPLHDEATLERIAAKVDRARLVAAAADLLRTIASVLPELQAYGEQQPQPTAACPGGGPPSIHNAPGQLAIDGTNCAVFTSDYILSIDFGGNDDYFNLAGSAAGGVSVAIDLSGNDNYERQLATSPLLTQGSAALGVGILWDVLGDDKYTATVALAAPQPGPPAGTATVNAQASAALGVGVLVDATGSNTFLATATSSGGAARVTAQGAGSLAGVGLLVSGADPLATGNTPYTARAQSTLHLVLQTPNNQQWTIGEGRIVAQGATDGGAGGLVDAGGNDNYDARALGGTGTATAQGAGSGGAGVLVDGQGNDNYLADAAGDVTLKLHIADANFCWTVTVNVNTADTTTVAQGAGSGGAGVLADLGGASNAYKARAFSRAEANSQVLLSASTACTNRAIATAQTGNAVTIAQGAGVTGVGVLIGSPGNDAYSTGGESNALAVALVNHGIIGEETTTATGGSVTTRNHGLALVGAGLLTDLGGNDGYGTAPLTSALRITHAGTLAGAAGAIDSRHSGWGVTGVGWLTDLGGGTDTYTLPIAGNDKCWTNPGQPGIGMTLNQGRGRDLPAVPVPLPAGCP